MESRLIIIIKDSVVIRKVSSRPELGARLILHVPCPRLGFSILPLDLDLERKSGRAKIIIKKGNILTLAH